MFKNLNKQGAVDMIFIAALVIVLAVGGLVYWRISNADEIQPVESTFVDGLGEEQTITSFEECMEWVMPWEELEDGRIKCTAPGDVVFYSDVSNSSGEESSDLEAGTFSFDGETSSSGVGTFQASGYITEKVINEPFCETDCDQYILAMFNIVNTPNEYIVPYMALSQGNTFYEDKSFSIGCVEDGAISWSNFNDANIATSGSIEGSDANELISSSEDNLVSIQAERLRYTSGRGAPACYSHFTNYEVL